MIVASAICISSIGINRHKINKSCGIPSPFKYQRRMPPDKNKSITSSMPFSAPQRHDGSRKLHRVGDEWRELSGPAGTVDQAHFHPIQLRARSRSRARPSRGAMEKIHSGTRSGRKNTSGHLFPSSPYLFLFLFSSFLFPSQRTSSITNNSQWVSPTLSLRLASPVCDLPLLAFFVLHFSFASFFFFSFCTTLLPILALPLLRL